MFSWLLDSIAKQKAKEIAEQSSPLSEFVRNASSAQKKKLYKAVLRAATEDQQRTLEDAQRKRRLVEESA